MEILEATHRGEIKGLLSICFNPLVSLPDANYVREALEKLEFYCVIDFFLSETAHHADVVLAGSLQEEEEGVVCTGEGRVVKINKAVDPPGNARADSRILVELAHLLGKQEYFQFASTRDIFEELRVASKGGTADYSGITWERLEKEMGLFWPVPSEDHPGTPRFFEGGHFKHPDGKARFLVAEHRECGDPLDDEFPLHLTTGRVVSQFLSGTQTRRIGPLVDQCPEPQVEIHPELASQAWDSERRHGYGAHSTGIGHAPALGSANDSARHRLHPLSLARTQERKPADAPDPRSKEQDPGVQEFRVPH